MDTEGELGPRTVTVSWDAPDDDSVTGYQILRRRPHEGEKTLLVYVEDTGSTDTTWTDRDVTIGTRHVYRVKAINAAGLSRVSFYARATPASPPENSPATGAPTITGTARVGGTLTADTSGISDDNGLANATFSYQWLADDADISGATSLTYTLTTAEEGKAVKVQVSFTDDAGHDETLTSAATAAVAALQPDLASVWVIYFGKLPPLNTGDTFTLSAGLQNEGAGASEATTLRYYRSTDAIIDTSDTEVGTYDVSAFAASESTSDSKELTAPDTAATYYYGACVDAVADESDTTNNCSSGYEIEVVGWNSPATGAPTITGKAQVGETLTADTSGIDDDDGLATADFSYQWLADDADISGATGSAYTLADGDESKAVKARVSFTDDRGYQESLTSAATTAVAPRPNNPAGGAPTITGTIQVGEVLAADKSGISDEDGLTNTAFSYQWISNDGGADTDIAGATGSTHTLADADEGKTIKVRVSFTDDAGYQESLTSLPTQAVAGLPPEPEPTPEPEETVPAKPTGLSVSTEPGLLDVSVDWNDVDAVDSYLVRWRSVGKGEKLNEGVEAGSSQATVTVADYGTWVVRVQACNGAGCGKPLAKQFEVEPAPEPEPEKSVPGSLESLAVSATPGSLNLSAAWDAADGADSYKVRWKKSDGSFEAGNETTVTATSADFTVSDYGQWDVQAEGCNDVGCGPSASRSVAIVPGSPSNLAVSTTEGSLDLSAAWDAADGAGSYKVRWRKSGGSFEAGNEATVTAASADLTVSDYGQWEVQLQGCNDAGCGPSIGQQVEVETAADSAPLTVSVTASALELAVGEPVTLSAAISNPPGEGNPTYSWEMEFGGSWSEWGANATFSYAAGTAESQAFRVTVSYGSGESATSNPLVVTWVEPSS